MTVKYFGPYYSARVLEEDEGLAPIPVGQFCLRCEEPIGDADSGVITLLGSLTTTVGTTLTEVVYHKNCIMRSVRRTSPEVR